MNLIKKITFVMIILSLSLLFISFSKNKNVTIKGYIHSYGNEPLTFLGIETQDGKEYGIKADSETIIELKSMGGKLLKFEGIVIENEKNNFELQSLKDGIFEVFDWKPVKK